MNSKAAALVLAFLLLFTGFAQDASVGSDRKQIDERLMEEVYNCAIYINDFNEAQTIALGDVTICHEQKFYNLNSYKRFPIAEAGMDFVIKVYDEYKKQSNILSADEYLDLMLSGVEVEELIRIYESMDDTYETYLEYLEEVLWYFRGDMWFKPYYDYVYDMAGMLISDILFNQRIQCLELNYLLTYVSDQEAAEAVWRRIFDECVLMSNQSMGGYYKDREEILAMIAEEKESRSRLFDEELIRNAAHLEYAEFILGEFEKGDLAVKKYLMHFDEEPAWFPMADWMRSKNAQYQYMLEIETEDRYIYDQWAWGYDESWTWKTCQIPPTEAIITIPDVGKEEVLSYLDSIAECGYDFSVETRNGKRIQDDDRSDMDIEIKKDGESFRILWSEDETYVYYVPLCVSLVPIQYIKLAQA